jgi:hypothetical protein
MSMPKLPSTGRVLAEKRPLRAAQNFDLVNIESIEQLGLDTGHNEVIDQHGNRRFEVEDDGILAHAAHREGCRIEAGDGRCGKVRYEAGKFTDVARARLLDRVRIDRADRNRGGLKIGIAASRRNDDFVKANPVIPGTAGPLFCSSGRKGRRSSLRGGRATDC